MTEKVTKRKYTKREKTAEQLEYMAKNPSKYYTLYFTPEERDAKRKSALERYYSIKYSRMEPDNPLRKMSVKALCFGFRPDLLMN